MSIGRPEQNETRLWWALAVTTLLIFAFNLAMAYTFLPILAGGFGVLPLFAALCFLSTTAASAIGIWVVKLNRLELLGAAFFFSFLILAIVLLELGRIVYFFPTPLLLFIMIGMAFPGVLILLLCQWLAKLLRIVR